MTEVNSRKSKTRPIIAILEDGKKTAQIGDFDAAAIVVFNEEKGTDTVVMTPCKCNMDMVTELASSLLASVAKNVPPQLRGTFFVKTLMTAIAKEGEEKDSSQFENVTGEEEKK